MRISDMISFVDRIKPNQYEVEDKMKWLNDIDGKILREVIATHEYSDTTPVLIDGVLVELELTVEDIQFPHDHIEDNLFAPDEYSNLYRYYLESQIDLANGDISKYNNTAAMFNEEYRGFCNYYNRNVLPLRKDLQL